MPTLTDMRTLLEEAGSRDVPEPRPEFIADLQTFLLGDSAATEEIRTLLEAAAERDVPTPRPEFVAGLEARLLGEGSTIARPIPLVARDGGRSRTRLVRPAMLSAAAVVAAFVLAGSLGGLFGQDPAQRRLELTSAIDTVVVLPGGDELPAEPGQPLPDGTTIQTGDEGSATVGNVELGPNQIATIEGGQIQVGPVEVTVPTVPDLPLPVDTTLPGALPLVGG
jgi:hypothetical protein